jgi:hypothetical protein
MTATQFNSAGQGRGPLRPRPHVEQLASRGNRGRWSWTDDAMHSMGIDRPEQNGRSMGPDNGAVVGRPRSVSDRPLGCSVVEDPPGLGGSTSTLPGPPTRSPRRTSWPRSPLDPHPSAVDVLPGWESEPAPTRTRLTGSRVAGARCRHVGSRVTARVWPAWTREAKHGAHDRQGSRDHQRQRAQPDGEPGGKSVDWSAHQRGAVLCNSQTSKNSAVST